MSKDKGKQGEPKKTPWEMWAAGLKPEVADAVVSPRPRRGPAGDYESFLASLSPEARAAVEAAGSDEPESEIAPRDDSEKRYGIVECFSGEFPVLKMFKRPENLAKYMATLEGKDVVTWQFEGYNIPVTVGPQRHLFFADHAMTIPLAGGEPVVVDSDKVTAEIQEDGFLGPPALANVLGSGHGPDDDEEEGEEENDDEGDDAAAAG